MVFFHQSLAGKTILITGFTGLLGSALAKYIKENIPSCKLVLASRSLNITDNASKNITYINNKDIRNIENVNIIFHFAFPTDSSFFIQSPVETMMEPINLYQDILFLAKKTKAKVVFLSSVEAYGYTNTDVKLKEEQLGYIDLRSKRSSYPETKRFLELLSYVSTCEFDLNISSVRLAQTFGKGVRKTDKRIFAFLANSVLKGEDIILKSSGNTKKDYISINDAIQGLLLVAIQGKKGEVYNLTNENNVFTINEMCSLCINLCNKKFKTNLVKIRHEIDKEGQYPKEQVILMDTYKIRELGFHPQDSLEKMFIDMIEEWINVKD